VDKLVYLGAFGSLFSANERGRRIIIRGGLVVSRETLTLGGRLAPVSHLDLTIYTTAFVQLDPARPNLAINHTGCLQFEPALRHQGARDMAADHCILRDNVASHDAIFTHYDGLPRFHSSFDDTFNPDRAIAFTVAYDLGSSRYD
jgi:hypothetical protein